MYSKVKLLGHPLHPMLVPFPIAFYVAARVACVTYAFQGDPLWFRLAFAANAAGIAMEVLSSFKPCPIPLSHLPFALDMPSRRLYGLRHHLVNRRQPSPLILIIFRKILGRCRAIRSNVRGMRRTSSAFLAACHIRYAGALMLRLLRSRRE